MLVVDVGDDISNFSALKEMWVLHSDPCRWDVTDPQGEICCGLCSRDDHRAVRLCGTLLLLVRELTEVISSCRRVWHLDSGYRSRWSVSLSSSFLLDGFGCLPGKWVFNLFLWSYHQHMCFVPHSHPRVVSPLKYNLHAICPPTWVCNLCIVTDVYSFVISGMLCKASSSQMALDF